MRYIQHRAIYSPFFVLIFFLERLILLITSYFYKFSFAFYVQLFVKITLK